MRLLFLSPIGQCGGAEVSLLELLAGLRAGFPEWPLHLIAGGDGLFVSRARALGVSVTIVPLPIPLARLGDSGKGGPAGGRRNQVKLAGVVLLAACLIVPYLVKLCREVRRVRPDLVHTNGFKMHILGVWATPHGVPLFWHIHDYVSVRPVMAILLRLHARWCTAAIANSFSVSRDVTAAFGSELPVHTVHNCVDVMRFSPVGPVSDLDALAGLPPAVNGTVRVGLVATFARWKGHEVFLHALERLPSDLPVRGYIVGGPLYSTAGSQHTMAELKTLAVRLGLENRVGFTGFLDDPAAGIRFLDIVVHASTQPEPFGLAIIEGMSCGRPVIVSRAGGAAEILDLVGNDAAVGCAPMDTETLAAKIRWLATDYRARSALGLRGCQAARQHFGSQRMLDGITSVYRQWTRMPGQPGAPPKANGDERAVL
jgi:glycosyltransferase involved in cell wall biosynthesis